MIHYQCNVATMMQLGKWFDYLRENGVYDNTRIIIVSDHGAVLSLPGTQIDPDSPAKYDSFNDIDYFKSLLLVKDFGSSELTTDETLMTNADTPTLAFSGLIDNPVNPFTGNKITSDYKDKPEQRIAYTSSWSTYENNGNAFKDITWIGLKGSDTSDTASWRIIGDTLD